jgi:ribosomal protein S18 acetylase RimI-like enzyme
VPTDYTLRRAEKSDHSDLYSLLDDEACRQHRHLDWHSPFDWLGYQPFWLLIKNQHVAAAMACPADPPGIAWIRLFGIAPHLRPLPAWNILFQKVLDDFASDPSIIFASIALQKWYSDMLLEAGYKLHQHIVVLSWIGSNPPHPDPSPLIIRGMRPEDLPAIRQIDQVSFEPIWQNSLSVITRSYRQSNYATVVELNGEIVGFQISSYAFDNAHLSRLAVLPNLQRQGIGRALVNDLVYHFIHNLEIRRITVNTQSDNHSSLALYDHMGFTVTGERFPVYILNPSSKDTTAR